MWRRCPAGESWFNMHGRAALIHFILSRWKVCLVLWPVPKFTYLYWETCLSCEKTAKYKETKTCMDEQRKWFEDDSRKKRENVSELQLTERNISLRSCLRYRMEEGSNNCFVFLKKMLNVLAAHKFSIITKNLLMRFCMFCVCFIFRQ